MKEDQTQLITARLEHLRFLMDSGHMPMFRHRSDMFLFALEAHNIARGLSSRYYRLREDLDIRFFVRFQFDYWLQTIQQWIEQLGGVEYRVEDDDFFAEGRAKRLTIVVNRLFGYHTDKLPADSAGGSMSLPDEEVLEPFRKIRQMKSTDLVASFKKALQEVHTYLLRLAMLPVEWSEENRREALRIYLEFSRESAHVQNEYTNYTYFCAMPDGQSVKSQFCYLRQRLHALTANGELNQLNLASSDEQELTNKLRTLFGVDEFNPSQDQIPANALPLADDSLFAKFLYLTDLDAQNAFPALDENKVSNFLIRKDVFLTLEQERNLQALFALMNAMCQHFDLILKKRNSGNQHPIQTQERIDTTLTAIKQCNACLATLLAHGQTIDTLDNFFERLFSPEYREEYNDGQSDLLNLFEKGRDSIKLEPYIHLLREANDHLHLFTKQTAIGKAIFQCLKDESIVADANEDTVHTYYTKSGYKSEAKWHKAIRLVDAVTAAS